ncbi:MAG: hypothetical protein QOI12_3834 [Alphaproteobacteria bacterium]|jgi:uncharacterized membrane protein|nr:hypothetical protein [Alphaproteobacteria bacterium]
MAEIVAWIAGLPLSLAIRRIGWITPLMQTLHILANAMVLSSVIMIDLRVWGLARSHTLVQSAHRFMPWVWAAMVMLTVTGIVLILVAPRRTLPDPTFQVKMLLMAVAMAATAVLQIAVRRQGAAGACDAGAHKMTVVIAAAALLLWIAVTFAGRGRWIAGAFG